MTAVPYADAGSFNMFRDYQTWVRDTFSIEPVPFMQIVAVFTIDGDTDVS